MSRLGEEIAPAFIWGPAADENFGLGRRYASGLKQFDERQFKRKSKTVLRNVCKNAVPFTGKIMKLKW